ncbi:MAG: fibronectin type III domain-containing protein, partial [Patescibacteria group bacterium]
ISFSDDLDRDNDSQSEDSGSVLMATVNKTIELMNRIASQVSLSTMQTALMTQFNSIEDFANLIPAPIMSGEPKVELTSTTETVSWHTDKESNSLVAIAKEGEYDGNKTEPYSQVVGLQKDNILNHSVIVNDLDPDTVYHYQIRSEGPIGPMGRSSDFIFRTPKEALEIGSYAVDNISPEKAAFKWVSNIETDSQIKYIPYRNNMLAVDETRTVKDKAFTTIHEIVISEFEAGTVYQIEISGKDAGGSIASKVIPTFFTSEEDLPPTISQVQTNLAISPGKDSKIQAVISWMTDEPSTSRVFYQKGFAASGTELAEKTSIDPNFTKKHAIVITKFDPGAIYTFKVESVDSGGNMTLSKTYTILAPKQRETVFQVIMKNFESMFGWVGNVRK